MPGQFYDEAMSRRQEALAATPDMRAQRAAMLAAMELQPGESVLDVGSGNGIMAREVLGIVGGAGAVSGLDASAPMIAMAQALCPGGTFVQGDAAALPFADASFDVVTAAQVICFLPDPDAALGEMLRVLRPGGRAVLLDTDWGSLVWNSYAPGLMARAMAALHRPYVDAHVPRTLSRRLAAAGFELVARSTLTVLNWTPGPDNYAALTAGFMEAMVSSSDDLSETDWRRWQEDQAAVAEAGEYLFSVNRYLFGARRP